jgi:hypothetical protein
MARGVIMGQGTRLRFQDRDDTRSMRRFVVSSDSLYPLTISFDLKVKPNQPIDRLVLAPNGFSNLNRPERGYTEFLLSPTHEQRKKYNESEETTNRAARWMLSHQSRAFAFPVHGSPPYDPPFVVSPNSLYLLPILESVGNRSIPSRTSVAGSAVWRKNHKEHEGHSDDMNHRQKPHYSRAVESPPATFTASAWRKNFVADAQEQLGTHVLTRGSPTCRQRFQQNRRFSMNKIRLAVACSVLFAFVVTTDVQAGRGIPIPIVFGTTEQIVHMSELPAQAKSALRSELGHEVALGYFYKSFQIFWLDVWTWQGSDVLYSGDRYWPLNDENWDRLADYQVGPRYGKPFRYRFPTGICLVAIVCALGVLKSIFAPSESEAVRRLCKNRVYQQAVQKYASQMSDEVIVENGVTRPARTPEEAFRDSVRFLRDQGIPAEKAEHNLKRILYFLAR